MKFFIYKIIIKKHKIIDNILTKNYKKIQKKYKNYKKLTNIQQKNCEKLIKKSEPFEKVKKKVGRRREKKMLENG